MKVKKIRSNKSTKTSEIYLISDCIAAEKLYCYNDWVLIDQNKERGKYLKNRGHFRLPECDELPRYNRSSKIPTCSYVGLTEMNQAEITCEWNFICRDYYSIDKYFYLR